MFGGDSDHYSWKEILVKTKLSGKDKTEAALQWDLFLAPHHCSWSFFNDRPQADHPEPTAESLEVLTYGRKDSKVIASSKEIIDDDQNPPHFEAKSEYVKVVKKENFLNTETYRLIGKTPQPIVFEIDESQITLAKQSLDRATKVATLKEVAKTADKPWCNR